MRSPSSSASRKSTIARPARIVAAPATLPTRSRPLTACATSSRWMASLPISMSNPGRNGPPRPGRKPRQALQPHLAGLDPVDVEVVVEPRQRRPVELDLRAGQEHALRIATRAPRAAASCRRSTRRSAPIWILQPGRGLDRGDAVDDEAMARRAVEQDDARARRAAPAPAPAPQVRSPAAAATTRRWRTMIVSAFI